MSFLLSQPRELSFETAGGEALNFRIEVFEHYEALAGESHFWVRVWIYELVRLPLIPLGSAGGDYAGSSVLVLSDPFDGFEHRGGTADSAADPCIAVMREQLGAP